MKKLTILIIVSLGLGILLTIGLQVAGAFETMPEELHGPAGLTVGSISVIIAMGVAEWAE